MRAMLIYIKHSASVFVCMVVPKSGSFKGFLRSNIPRKDNCFTLLYSKPKDFFVFE